MFDVGSRQRITDTDSYLVIVFASRTKIDLFLLTNF